MSEGRALVSRVLHTRRRTVGLCEPLSAEDAVVQAMPDASPAKWHLAHTTWFFERFVLRQLGLPPLDPTYEYLFNSYYDAVGARHPRPQRGLLTRPTLDEVLSYRWAIDEQLQDLEHSPRLHEVAAALELGLHHEQQHQELILTDLKYLFGCSPSHPAYLPRGSNDASNDPSNDASNGTNGHAAAPLSWHAFEGGVYEIGHAGAGFGFDNEMPRHKVYLTPFQLGSRLVTCGEYLAFMRDRGYERPELWLSEGLAWVRANAKRAPLHWVLEDGDIHREPQVFTLRGLLPFHPNEPVCHVSYFEADAYARWAGARLPSEAEWEVAAERASQQPRGYNDARGDRYHEGSPEGPDGNFADDEHLHPVAVTARAPGGEAPVLQPLSQMLGDAWEWTQSAYSPYPGFRPLEGAFGEYNGKFMVNQMVLRGGSCATPRGHVRTTYRNFFPTHAEWQFSGIRLARD